MNAKAILELCVPLIADSRHAWSMGTPGVSGEFMRAPGEAFHRPDTPDALEIATGKGALRIRPTSDVSVIAYDTPAACGEPGRQTVAFCVPARSEAPDVITSLGEDRDAVREEERGAALFDLGIGAGLVRMAVRTRDRQLIALLRAAEGRNLLGEAAQAVLPAILASQPHRVMLSTLGRIEVFQPIPPAGGRSPDGPHTHLLPKLISRQRLHGPNTPIPEGLQSVLSLHPPSAWRAFFARYDQAR